VTWHPGREPDRSAVRRAQPASYSWYVYDRIVSEARARGIHVLLTPTGPGSRWATYGRRNGVDWPSPGHFARFMEAAGAHFRRDVSYWSIWNEPNHPDFLGPQFRHGRPYSPRIYRRLFQAAMRPAPVGQRPRPRPPRRDGAARQPP
jgi:hypothetical protein